MRKPREFRSKALAMHPAFRYLPQQDRYLFASDPPAHRLTLIGAGYNGQEHLRVALLEGRAAIHGLYDPNPGSVAQARQIAAQLAPGAAPLVYDTLAAACADTATDGFIIATPNHTHAAVVREVAATGKPILLEKPMAHTLAEAAEIAGLAAGYGAVFQIGLQYRFKSIYVEARHEALARGAIGAIKTISLLEHRVPFLDKVGQWNKFARYSGGTLVEKCCHYFDLCNLFADARPVRVFATGGAAVNFRDFQYAGEQADILDHAFVSITYANGVQASFNLCMFAPLFVEELVLCGDAGRLHASERQDFLPTGRSGSHLEVICGEEQPSRISTSCYPKHIEETGHGGGTYLEHVAFLDAIEGQPTAGAGAAEGLWSVIVGVAAEQSIRTGTPIMIEELLGAAGINAV